MSSLTPNSSMEVIKLLTNVMSLNITRQSVSKVDRIGIYVEYYCLVIFILLVDHLIEVMPG